MTSAATSESEATSVSTIDIEQVDRANASGLQPVVFVHGLWLLPSSWDRWAAAVEEAGYTALTPRWPDDPALPPGGADDPAPAADPTPTPDVFAHKTVGQVADHFEEVSGGLDPKPAIVG